MKTKTETWVVLDIDDNLKTAQHWTDAKRMIKFGPRAEILGRVKVRFSSSFRPTYHAINIIVCDAFDYGKKSITL